MTAAVWLMAACGQLGFDAAARDGGVDARSNDARVDDAPIADTDRPDELAPPSRVGTPPLEASSAIQVVDALSGPDGARYVLGHFEGALRIGSVDHGNEGAPRSVFVLALGEAGELRWSQAWRATRFSVATSLALVDGVLEIGGHLAGATATPFVLQDRMRQRGVVVRLSAVSGEPVGEPEEFISSRGNAQLKAVLSTSSLRVLVGHYVGNVDFGLGPLGATPANVDHGSLAVFGGGALQWGARHGGANVQFEAAAVHETSLVVGGSYVDGQVEGLPTAMGLDGLVVVHATSGELRYRLALQSAGRDEVRAVAMTASGPAIGLMTDGEPRLFGPGNSGSLPSSVTPGMDALVLALNTAGALRWATRFDGDVHLTDLQPIDGDEVAVLGTFSGELRVEDERRASAGQRDVFLAELEANGALVRLRVLGGVGDEDDAALIVHADAFEVALGVEVPFGGFSDGDAEGPLEVIGLPQ
ncbi:MAG: hypothetical protein AAF645_09260 [Myxococcota bacterium]